MALEIEASGIRNGEVFHERTFTQNVSDWGCGFWMMLELKPEDMVMVRKTSRDPAKTPQPSQSLFQVMRVVRKDDRWLVGAWKMDRANVWGADPKTLEQAQEDGLESRRQETINGDELERKDVNS